ncbi:hypothetical protein BLNAU_6984 [Blattamonas nauphoetae]|uniref:Uncharacterized protein n=1 Tax=Blattamonas nauphoetae TaxID=2049346 RepID=A0ABQ9Y2Y4_9EUKA|nr:hypothetical protein BLNAU_6984 [Blattamonas nauphoetae]
MDSLKPHQQALAALAIMVSSPKITVNQSINKAGCRRRCMRFTEHSLLSKTLGRSLHPQNQTAIPHSLKTAVFFTDEASQLILKQIIHIFTIVFLPTLYVSIQVKNVQFNMLDGNCASQSRNSPKIQTGSDIPC